MGLRRDEVSKRKIKFIKTTFGDGDGDDEDEDDYEQRRLHSS